MLPIKRNTAMIIIRGKNDTYWGPDGWVKDIVKAVKYPHLLEAEYAASIHSIDYTDMVMVRPL